MKLRESSGSSVSTGMTMPLIMRGTTRTSLRQLLRTEGNKPDICELVWVPVCFCFVSNMIMKKVGTNWKPGYVRVIRGGNSMYSIHLVYTVHFPWLLRHQNVLLTSPPFRPTLPLSHIILPLFLKGLDRYQGWCQFHFNSGSKLTPTLVVIRKMAEILQMELLPCCLYLSNNFRFI